MYSFTGQRSPKEAFAACQVLKGALLTTFRILKAFLPAG
jgi:hypothetical protein